MNFQRMWPCGRCGAESGTDAMVNKCHGYTSGGCARAAEHEAMMERSKPQPIADAAPDDVEALVAKMREWAGNCSGYSADHMKNGADEEAQYHRGASEAFTRCADALATLRT